VAEKLLTSSRGELISGISGEKRALRRVGGFWSFE